MSGQDGINSVACDMRNMSLDSVLDDLVNVETERQEQDHLFDLGTHGHKQVASPGGDTVTTALTSDFNSRTSFDLLVKNLMDPEQAPPPRTASNLSTDMTAAVLEMLHQQPRHNGTTQPQLDQIDSANSQYTGMSGPASTDGAQTSGARPPLPELPPSTTSGAFGPGPNSGRQIKRPGSISISPASPSSTRRFLNLPSSPLSQFTDHAQQQDVKPFLFHPGAAPLLMASTPGADSHSVSTTPTSTGLPNRTASGSRSSSGSSRQSQKKMKSPTARSPTSQANFTATPKLGGVETTMDKVDATIYTLFPLEALRMERPDFSRWRRENRIRTLSAVESKRLTLIRRQILSKVYADKTKKKREELERSTRATMRWLRVGFHSAMVRNDDLQRRLAAAEAILNRHGLEIPK